ncbi:hypothetical protein FB451DRAFT_1238046 [Mycena latifolia]|nr:hypothetical protein FB451DRAFT_1238046 [Mycena latifolia]
MNIPPTHLDPSWGQHEETLVLQAAYSSVQYVFLWQVAMALAFAILVLSLGGLPAHGVRHLSIGLGLNVVVALHVTFLSFIRPLVFLADSTHAGRGIQVALATSLAAIAVILGIHISATFILILASGLRRVSEICNLHDALKGRGEELAELRLLTDAEETTLADIYQAVGALCQDVLDGKLDRAGWFSIRWYWKARAMMRKLKENITTFTNEIVLARPSDLVKTDEKTRCTHTSACPTPRRLEPVRPVD